MDKIRAALLNAKFGLLDGLHFLAFHPTAWEDWTNIDAALKRKATLQVGIPNGFDCKARSFLAPLCKPVKV